MIRAKNSWILSLDNLSGIKDWLSDALCRLSTGGGLTTRKLYTGSDEEIFDAMRSAIMNGIGEIADRPDLLERCLIITLEPIDDSMRRTEVELVAEFQSARAGILGALLDGVTAAVRYHKEIVLPEKPRMADAVVWASAAESGLRLQPGSFLRAYQAFRSRAVGDSLGNDPLAVALQKFMAGQVSWKGTATELLAELKQANTEDTWVWESLPKVNKLSTRLDQSASFLRRVGLDVRTHQREGHDSTRIITIKQNPVTARTVGTEELSSESPGDTQIIADDQADSSNLGLVGKEGAGQDLMASQSE